jgi:hypothetical protein
VTENTATLTEADEVRCVTENTTTLTEADAVRTQTREKHAASSIGYMRKACGEFNWIYAKSMW